MIHQERSKSVVVAVAVVVSSSSSVLLVSSTCVVVKEGIGIAVVDESKIDGIRCVYVYSMCTYNIIVHV